ncbi:response regulator [Candidatus Woesearchaeota archaeon]|nr:response regulator [Candidatus Woesearchaeota archaeon]
MTNTNRILVLDDVLANQRLYSAALRTMGEVIIANNGQEGLEKFTAEPESYVLILTDNTMPIMSGMNFLQQIAKYKLPSRLMISSDKYPDDMHKTVVRFGGLGLYQKPVSIRELRQIVTELLSEGVSPTLEEYFKKNY